MAGYTDPAFRVICQKFGAQVVYTEMVSVEAIWRQNKKTLKMLELLPEEKNTVLQLFGSKTDSFVKALKIITKYYKSSQSEPAGIDINFGCPVKKIAKSGAGAVLMNNLVEAKKITQSVCEKSPWPVSVKIRAKVHQTTALDFVKQIKDLPISAIMIHGRSLSGMFSGEINYQTIKKVKELLPSKIVLANGGINSSDDAKKMLDKTKADGLGIARGAWGNPFIFSQIKNVLENKEPLVIDKKLIKKTVLEQIKLYKKTDLNVLDLRKQLIHYFKNSSNAKQIRQKIIKANNFDELQEIVEGF